MQLIWALRFLLLYLLRSVVCRAYLYGTGSRSALVYGGQDGMSIHTPNAQYHISNGYPSNEWRIMNPSSWNIPWFGPQSYSSYETQKLSDQVDSPLLTKLGYYEGSEYHLPNFVIRPIVFQHVLQSPSDMGQTDPLTITENSKPSHEHFDNDYFLETHTLDSSSSSAEDLDEPDPMIEKPNVQDIPDFNFSVNITLEHYWDHSFQTSTEGNALYPSEPFDVKIESILPTHSNYSANGLLHQNSSHDSEKINILQNSLLTTEQSSGFDDVTKMPDTEEENGIANVITEISTSHYSTVSISEYPVNSTVNSSTQSNHSNEIEELYGNGNFTVESYNTSSLVSPSTTQNTNIVEGSKIQQMFNVTNELSTSTEYLSTPPTESSYLNHSSDSEYSSESSTKRYFVNTQIPTDLSTISMEEASLYKPNKNSSLVHDINVLLLESLNSSNNAEDASIFQKPGEVLLLNVSGSTEESSGLNETSTVKQPSEHFDNTIGGLDQNDIVNETENPSTIPNLPIFLTSPNYSKDPSVSEFQEPTTQHPFHINEASESNEQMTTSESPNILTTNYPLEMTNLDKEKNLTTEINANFNNTQELNYQENENENLQVTTNPLTTNSDDTTTYFPTNYMNEFAISSSVTETQHNSTQDDEHESENDSIIFPYNTVLQEKDIADNYHHNIPFKATRGNVEPLGSDVNYDNGSDIPSDTGEPSIETPSSVSEGFKEDTRDDEKNMNEDDSIVTEQTTIVNINNAEKNSRNEYPENSWEENPLELQDDYTISPKYDKITPLSEKSFTSTNDLKVAPQDEVIDESNEPHYTLNKSTEENPSVGSYPTATTWYMEYEKGNSFISPDSENSFYEAKKNYYNPTTSSIPLHDQVNGDVNSQLSMTSTETNYESSKNQNQDEIVNSHTEFSNPFYSVTETGNSPSFLHEGKTQLTEDIEEAGKIDVYKGGEFSAKDYVGGNLEKTDYHGPAQIAEEEYSPHNYHNVEYSSDVNLPNTVPTYSVDEMQSSTFPLGGSLLEIGDGGLPDPFYGSSYPEAIEQSHSLKKYLPSAEDDFVKDIGSGEDDAVDPSYDYFEQSSENPYALAKENEIRSDHSVNSHKLLTENDSKEYTQTPNEEVYNASLEDLTFDDITLPQENKKWNEENNFGPNFYNFPNSMGYTSQTTKDGIHRSDIPIDDEYSDNDPNFGEFLQRNGNRRKRHATTPETDTQKPETQPSDAFSDNPNNNKKIKNENIPSSRVKRTFDTFPLLSMFFKKPELAEPLGLYKGKLLKVGLRPLLQHKLNFLHKKIFLTSLLAGLLGKHDHGAGIFKRSPEIKPLPPPKLCDSCDHQLKLIQSSKSRESLEDDDYSDDYYYSDETSHKSAERSYTAEATPVYDDSDASITDLISMLPSFEEHFSD